MATVRIQLRRGTAAQWTSANPTLVAGEMGVETDTRKVKVGDGTTAWTSLDYVAADSPEISEIAQDAINDALVAGTGITKSYDDNANTITVSVDTSIIATKAELAEVSQDSINDALVAGVGLDKTYDDVNNLITIDIDSTVATLTGTQTLTNKTLTSPVINGATVGGNIIPTADNTYDLGSSTNMWKDIYVGPGSLYVNGQKVLQDESGNIVVSADSDENLSLRTSGSGNIELDPTGAGNIQIKGPLSIQAGSNISSSDGNGIAFSSTINTDSLSSRSTNTDLSISANGTGKVYINDNAEVSGNLIVGGNLTISGTTTSLNTETLSVADNIIDLNSNYTTGAPSENAGIRVIRGDESNTQIRWNETNDVWELTNDGSAYSAITTASTLSSHASDTTDIHGIANTANLVTVDGSQLLSNKAIDNPIVKGNLVLEGTTDNDYELTLTTDPTADRNIIFPDNSGTVALISNLSNYAELAGATFTGAVSGTDLTLSGNLTVNGTTTTLNTTDLSVEDKNVVLGDTDSPSDASADGGGITLKGSTDKTLIWQDSTDSWSSSENFNLDANKTYKINGSIVLSNSEVLGKSVPSGTIVGTSDTQTITNKSISLTDNTVSGTLAEFNSALSDADFVSLTGAETLTNKTLQSPAISSPTGILKGDVELGNVDNTSDLDKPVSTATQSALDLKADLAGPTFTGTVVLPATTSIGNVSSSEIETLDGIGSNIQTQIDAKSPSADPTFTGTVVLPATTSIGNVSSSEIETLDGVTSNIQTQLNARLESATAASTYAPIESPTFTGTVSGITKTMVGLSNVDNTADTAKPVSTATQSALDLKADLAGPTFTGTVTLPGTTSIGDVSSTEIGYVNGVTSAIQTQINAKAASADVSSHTSATTSVHGISDTAQLAYLNAASQTFTGSVEIDQNLTVDGNLTVNGTTFNASSTSIVIEDNMVQLAHQNAANTVDLGIVVAYNDGSAKHSGIVRDVSDSKWKIFKDVADEPATTVNFGQGSLDNLAVNNIEVAGVVFTDGTQTKEAVPSRTVIYGAANSNAITASATLSDLAYRDSLIEVNSASSVTLTVPPNSTAAFPIGASWDIVRMGSGGVVIAAGSGVTINATPGLNLRAQYSSATLFKRGTDSWLLIGDLSA